MRSWGHRGYWGKRAFSHLPRIMLRWCQWVSLGTPPVFEQAHSRRNLCWNCLAQGGGGRIPCGPNPPLPPCHSALSPPPSTPRILSSSWWCESTGQLSSWRWGHSSLPGWRKRALRNIYNFWSWWYVHTIDNERLRIEPSVGSTLE